MDILVPRKLTQNEFLERCYRVHGDRYDYSKVTYIRSTDKIRIKCPVHGEFLQRALAHMQGDGCAFCSGKRNTTAIFIEKAIKAHGNRYDYSRTVYVSTKILVSIRCRIHGIFEQLPGNHLDMDARYAGLMIYLIVLGWVLMKS